MCRTQAQETPQCLFFVLFHLLMVQCQVWCSRERTWRICASYNLAYKDPQLTAVYAESPDEKRECHDSIETLTAHWKLCSRLTSVVMSDQELVEQGKCQLHVSTPSNSGT